MDGEAAQLLVDLGVKGVGIDAVSLGGYDDPAKAGPPHRTLLGNGKFIVEELYFPDEVMDGRKRLFCAAPIKLRGAVAHGREPCSGSSTSAAAVRAPLSRTDLERRVGRLDQIAGITPVELIDGRSRGVRAFDVATGSGFAFTAIADRALDVARASYKGIALSWLSRNGIVAPAYYEPQGDAFLRLFFGGLFTTCGLTNFGPPGTDRWGSFGLHGRIDATPAEEVVHETRWEGDDCILEIRGTIRQTRIFGEDLRLERCLRTKIGGKHLEIHDIVTNEGGTRVPHMILYHCNGGFPLLGDSSELHLSQSSMRPRDDEAKKGPRCVESGREAGCRNSPNKSLFTIPSPAPMAGLQSYCTMRSCARPWPGIGDSIRSEHSFRRSSHGECSDMERMLWGSNQPIARQSKAG